VSETSIVVSDMDREHLLLIRRNVVDFVQKVARQYLPSGHGRVLDIAPQDHEGAQPFFPQTVEVETLDINPEAGCTYTGDICSVNHQIADGRYDVVICTEVLEHTLQPFNAVRELRRVLKPGGVIALSTPLNFRIHGPLPDCWRFTIHGLRVLLSDFDILEINSLETPGRDLMPIHYTAVARKRREL
jgi:SAM-dependent methyltransferase